MLTQKRTLAGEMEALATRPVNPSLAGGMSRYFNMKEASRRLGDGRDGKPIHPSTLVRWILDGVKAADGTRIKLRAIRLPGGWRTTAEWLDEFIGRLTADRLGADSTLEPAPVLDEAARDHELATDRW